MISWANEIMQITGINGNNPNIECDDGGTTEQPAQKRGRPATRTED